MNRLGRFSSTDLHSGDQSNPQSLNRFSYVTNNPITFVDPFGMDECDDDTSAECDDDGGAGGGSGGGVSSGPTGNPMTDCGAPMCLCTTVGGVFQGCVAIDCSSGAPYVSCADPGPSPPIVVYTFGGGGSIFGGGTITQALTQLKSFKPNLKQCMTDLKVLGLAASTIQNLASTVKLVNANANQALLARMPGADFSPVMGAPTPTLAYNSDNFWQQSFGDLLGTLVHEFAHLNNPGPSGEDAAMQKALVIKQDPSNTTNISMKLAADCFPNAKPPNP